MMAVRSAKSGIKAEVVGDSSPGESAADTLNSVLEEKHSIAENSRKRDNSKQPKLIKGNSCSDTKENESVIAWDFSIEANESDENIDSDKEHSSDSQKIYVNKINDTSYESVKRLEMDAEKEYLEDDTEIPDKKDICNSVEIKEESNSEEIEEELPSYNIKEASRQDFNCTKCLFKTKQKGALVRHLEKSHGENPKGVTQIYCQYCWKSYTTRNGLKFHINKIHLKKSEYKCETCGKIFLKNEKSMYESHRTIHSQEKKYSCSKCERTFRHRFSLKRHQQTCDRSRNRRADECEDSWLCDVCGRGFQDFNSLKDHKVGKHSAPSYSCTCGRMFQWRSSLRKHRSKCEKLFGCPLCNYESKYSQNIRSHYLIHMNVKPWICEICGSAFVSKCNLRHHMVSHSNDRPFKCVTCGMGFKQKVVLQQHIARHNEDRQYVCEQCGKGFCISGDLKKHIRTHTGEKPYTCEVCFKQFSDNSSYARHRYIHLETKNYACPKCNKRFSRQDMCNSHMKTHNNDDGTGVKQKKSKVKRTRKSDVDACNVVEEQVEVENRDVAPREHLYHIENYAKEIQERTYTEMNSAGDFAVVNNGYPQQQHQVVQVYPQRQDPSVQESYPRDYTAMWPNLHFY